MPGGGMGLVSRPDHRVLYPCGAVTIVDAMKTLTEDHMGSVLHRIVKSPFFAGMARALDLTGSLNRPMPYNRDEDSRAADIRAMREDWVVVGRDISTAAERLEEEYEHATR